MNIAEMHVAFRQYAQQLGMQNVRAILPEQIDVLLNQSIMDTLNQLIRENIGVTSDRIITDNSKIGQINALRNLYSISEIEFVFGENVGTTIGSGNDAKKVNFAYKAANRLTGLVKHTFDGTKDAKGNVTVEDTIFKNYLWLVDISINYKSDNSTGASATDDIITAWYPVRIIDSAYLADTLNDFILKNRFRSPVACIYENDTIELYIDKFEAGNDPKVNVKSGANTIGLVPYKLRVDLIKHPNIVKYVEDISEGASVDCDLPDNMHGDIVKHAVDMYRIAVSGQLQNQPQQPEQGRQQATQE